MVLSVTLTLLVKLVLFTPGKLVIPHKASIVVISVAHCFLGFLSSLDLKFFLIIKFRSYIFARLLSEKTNIRSMDETCHSTKNLFLKELSNAIRTRRHLYAKKCPWSSVIYSLLVIRMMKQRLLASGHAGQKGGWYCCHSSMFAHLMQHEHSRFVSSVRRSHGKPVQTCYIFMLPAPWGYTCIRTL